MTTVEKSIKYFGITLAILLSVAIFSLILSTVYEILSSFNFITEKDVKEEYKYNEYDETINLLDVDIRGTNLKIETNKKLAVETSNKDISVTINNNKLMIKDNSKKVIGRKKLKDLTIYIPENIEFEKVKIAAGAGKVNIKNIFTKDLIISLGAGSSNLNNINSQTTKIETGAGSVNINDSNLNNLDLDLGVGEVKLNSNITGNSKIDSGIGKVNLLLPNFLEYYTFELSKGVGEIKLNGELIRNDTTIGSGENYLKIDGGIGEINIKTK